MTLLRDRDWAMKYTPDDGDLVRLFYAPALRAAVQYDRLTGYFTAEALKVAARGVEGLIANGGRMRLVVGCTLDQPEIDAVEKGESLRGAIERAMLALPDLGGDPSHVDALEVLAWMVANDRLVIKVAVRCDAQRRPIRTTAIFHEKTGIITDKTGDQIAFTGSINETRQGWTENWDSFSVYTSWEEGKRVRVEADGFAKLWADKARTVMVRDFPEAVREKLLEFLPKDDAPRRLREIDLPEPEPVETSPAPAPEPSIEDQRAAFWRRVFEAARDPVGGDRVAEATAAVAAWPHQLRAFHRMYDNWPPRLLIADEVGLGKTIQAGLLLRQAWLAGRAKRILILAPKSVCRQWQIELREKFNLDWPIYDGARLVWPACYGRPEPIERPVGRDAWHREPFVIMSSHLARRRDRLSEFLEGAEPWDVIVLDEAHHARVRGAGSTQESGPNALLRLMRGLREKAAGLLLLTATPMQVHPVELWDLLDLLGLPPEWSRSAFVAFFQDVARQSLTVDVIEKLAALFRASEGAYGEVSRDRAERLSGLGRIQARRVLEGLRDRSSIPRRRFSEAERTAAAALVRGASPVKALVSRHTRETLRRYQAEGRLGAKIAARRVEDRFIALSPAEAEVYAAVERYISTTYRAAATAEAGVRNAVGFVLTIYRRRLASSFLALRRTLEGRRSAMLETPELIAAIEEDIADAVELGEEIDAEMATAQKQEALAVIEKGDIARLLAMIAELPVDTKAARLAQELRDLRDVGYAQAMVFTQFTDTLDFLREEIARDGHISVMCFSGRGGEVRGADGRWTTISREEVKRRFKDGRAEVLLCTDAAAEGLNFQFCGALINYDLPWNPMRVEQRIGRIDRLGQRYDEIRIINFHYRDTVETDVYVALRDRIGLFERVVGGLQPILTSLPRLIESAALAASGGAAPTRGADAADELLRRVDAGEGAGLDLTEFIEADFDEVRRPDPALTLEALKSALATPSVMPSGYEALPMDADDFRLTSGVVDFPLRVTVSRELYDAHPDNCCFWTQGAIGFPKQEH